MLNDGSFLTDSAISNIIQRMTTFIANNSSLNLDISNYQKVANNTDLMDIINTAWT